MEHTDNKELYIELKPTLDEDSNIESLFVIFLLFIYLLELK